MNMDNQFKTLEALANGIDPNTGEVLPEQSPYNSPLVIRALFSALDTLKVASKKIKKTPEQKQQDNIEKGLPMNAGLPWNDEQRELLADQFTAQASIADLAEIHSRTRGAITSELKKQGLIEE